MGYIWLCVVALLLVLFFLCPLRLCIEYGYSKNANKQRLSVFINGIQVFKSDFEKKAKTAEEKPAREKKDDYGGFMDKLRHYDALYTGLKDDVINILQYLRSRCRIPKFVMHLDMGFADAAQTGMAAGAAYALIYGISGLVYNHLNIKKKEMDVYVAPHFNKACIDFYFHGIFHLRLVHIIRVLVMAIGVYNKSKKIK